MVYIFSFIAIMCVRSLRHNSPINYIMLLIFTLSMAFMVAGVTAYVYPPSLMLVIGILMTILGCIWMAAVLTTDKVRAARNVCLGMIAAILVMYMVTIPMMITWNWDGLYLLWGTVGVIVASGMIYLDVFIIMLAGKYAMDEYIFCALMLYIDIIRLLLYLIMIFGKGK